MFLRKFYQQDPNFKQKFQTVLKFLSRESDRYTPSLLGRKTKGHIVLYREHGTRNKEI